MAARASVALFATVLWWGILYLGGMALGYPVAALWLVPVLGCIFLLLMLGLSMADMAARGTSAVPEVRRDDGIKTSQRRVRARFRSSAQ
jgi:hypothetical protein